MLLTPAARCVPQQVETSPRKSQRLLKSSALYIYPDSVTTSNFWCLTFARENFLRFLRFIRRYNWARSRRSLLSLRSACLVGHQLASSCCCFPLKRTSTPHLQLLFYTFTSFTRKYYKMHLFTMNHCNLYHFYHLLFAPCKFSHMATPSPVQRNRNFNISLPFADGHQC